MNEPSRREIGPPRSKVHRVVELSPADDVRREIAFHLEMRTAELIEQGWEPSQASEEARRQFGDETRTLKHCLSWAEKRERARERRNLLGELGRNTKVALRRFRMEPVFTLTAILTLALGIGANTAIFSFVKGILLDPLPFEDSDRLVTLREISHEGVEIPVASPNFVDWRSQAESFEVMALYEWPGQVTIRGTQAPRTAMAMRVSGGFFEALRVSALRGRLFDEQDLRPGAPITVVVSHAFWRSQLQGLDPVDEPVLEIDGTPVTVIGVLPEGFDLGERVDLFGAYGLEADHSSRTAQNYRVLARLADGVSLSEARAEMSTIGARLAREHEGDINSSDVVVRPMIEDVVGGTTQALWLLMVAAGLVLLVTCANLAIGSLARALGRSREIAVQAALGAGRGGVARQLFTEALLLAAIGGVCGIGVASLLRRLLIVVAPRELPRLGNVELDPGVLLAGVVFSTLAGLVFGLFPALRVLRLDLSATLRAGGRSGSGGRGASWGWLVIAEVAVATLLLLGCALFLRSLWGLMNVDKGFESSNVLTLPVVAPYSMPEYEPEDFSPWVPFEEQLIRYYDDLLESAASAPGVEQVALASSIPTQGFGNTMFYLDNDDNEVGSAGYIATSAGYFSLLGIPLHEGRVFEDTDRTELDHVAVVDRAFTDRFLEGREPLGVRIRPPGMDIHGDRWLTIIGVVGSVRHRSLAREDIPHVYVSLRQRPSSGYWSTLLARSSAPAAAVADSLGVAMRERHPELPIEISTLDERLAQSVARTRFLLRILLAFAVLATVLVVTGISGIVANAVVERRQELGVRSALGARPESLLLLVARHSLMVLGVGTLVGVGLAFACGRFVESQLYGVAPTDGAMVGATVAVLLACGGLAAMFPALRAARVDPSKVLRG